MGSPVQKYLGAEKKAAFRLECKASGKARFALGRLLAILAALLFIFAAFLPRTAAEPKDAAAGCPAPLVLPADKVMRISPEAVEFEHHGTLPISPSVECYHHWEDQARSVPLAAVLVGFQEVTATIFGGEIVRFDVHDPLYIRTMRVALSTDRFAGIEHEELCFEPTSRLFVEEKGTGRGFVVEKGDCMTAFVRDGRLCLLDAQDTLWEFGQRLYLWADPDGMIQINTFQRGTGPRFYPRYRGSFELTVLSDSTFLAINEVDLEEYLYQVVPSEMVISWPLEALKAQAVASRTYAVAQVIYSRQGRLGFHVSDSTSSQVYNNQPEAASTTRAILETSGQILAGEDSTVGSAYFYSTSSRGMMISKGAWNNLAEFYLEGKSPWYRWQCTLSADQLGAALRPYFAHSLGELLSVEVQKRDELGRVISLLVKGTAGEGSIGGELAIRQALRPARLQRMSDSLTGLSLLPSAMFFIQLSQDAGGKLKAATFFGGGSGHGLGMSQWGAKGLAEAGYDYLRILSRYYPQTRVITHSDQLRY